MGEDMTVDSRAIDWHVQAVFCELLAKSFAYPTRDFVDVLVSGEYGEAVAEIADVLGIEVPAELVVGLKAYEGADVEALLHTLRAEATRLFIGAPEPLVSPYEGVWRAKDDGVTALLFVNPHSMAVERFMKSCGVGQPEGKNEPLDHVATELEFLEYLASLEARIAEPNPALETPEDGWDGAFGRFMEEHARVWMPRFADAVIAETREPFYRAVATLLKELFPSDYASKDCEVGSIGIEEPWGGDESFVGAEKDAWLG